MSGFSPAEIVTLSFYAWEIRGRGWELSPYPVSLEPPFRPFRILPGLVPEAAGIDDGRRPTFVSSLIEGVKETFRTPKPFLPASAEPFEEPLPFPAYDEVPLVTLQMLVPGYHGTKPRVMVHLLSALGSSLHPVAIEIIGSGGSVTMQLTCAETDREHVESQLLSFAPEISVIEAENLVESRWEEGCEHALVDFGLSQEFFLPLLSLEGFPLDPYVTLIPALSRAETGEFAAVQVRFERVRNPWDKTIREAVRDGDGGSLFSDAPEFPRLAEEKVRTPLFAVSLRVAAQAETSKRAWELARGTGVFFRQFSRPGANELLPLENAGYPDDEHAEAFRDYRSFRTGMLLSAEELGALCHLPDATVSHPSLVRAGRRTKPPPPEALGNSLILGRNVHRGSGTEPGLSREARFQHTWIIGASGSGKSNLLLNLILQDIEAGEGLAVLDPHGDLIDDILAQVPEKRWTDIVLFDPSDADYPVGFNILSAGSEAERSLLASDIVGVFRRLSANWGDTMGTILGNAVLAILESSKGGTLIDLRRFLVDERFRKEFLETVADEEIRFFWRREYPLIGSRSIGPILTRLDTFLRPKIIRHIVGQRDGKLDLRSLMQGRKVLLAKLSLGLIGEENAYLLGSLLLGKFQELALSRQQHAKEARTPFFLYADEFQNFITPSLETLLTGARKYGVGLVLAHQTLAQLSALPRVESALFGNAYSRIVFRTGEQDAKRLSEGFSFFDASDISGLGRGEAIVRLGSASNDFNLSTSPVPRPDDGAGDARKAVVSLSREKYGTPLHALMTAFAEQYGPRETPNEEVVIEKNGKSAIQAEEDREEEPRKVEEPVLHSRAEPRMAARKEKVPEQFPSGRGGQEHKYLQHLVKRLALERGFRASIEAVAGEGRADVVLQKSDVSVGVEISITTDSDHEAENLRKCIGASFTHVLFVSPDARRRRELAKRFADSRPPVLVSSPEELVATIDAIDPGPVTTETTVRGYKVKVKRQTMLPEEVASRRSAVAAVVAKSLAKRAKS